MIQRLYDHSPVGIQNIFCSLYAFKEKRIRYSKDFYKYLEFLEETDFWSEKRIREYKNEQFREIFRYAYKEIPYYHKVFNEHGLSPRSVNSLEDIEKLPLLTKEDVIQNWNDLYKERRDLIKRKTSGTTGTALNFYSTHESIAFQWAVWWRHRMRFEIHLHDKSLNFIGKRVVPIGQHKPPYWRINKVFNQHLINMQQIKKSNISSIVDHINQEKFKFFSGYPSILYALAENIKESSLTIQQPPRMIFTGAEKLYNFQKDVIEDVFNCKVADQYGFSEGAGNASTCEYGIYHEDFEFGHIEVHAKNKKTSEGEVLATGFSNFGMPLLRYRVGDSVREQDEICKCGRKSRAFKSFLGRVEDYVLTPEGAKIKRFDYLFKNTPNIKECQIIQRNLTELVLKIVSRSSYDLREEEQLKAAVSKWISPSMDVKFEYCKEIPRTKAGKFQAVKSLIK